MEKYVCEKEKRMGKRRGTGINDAREKRQK